jgi:UDP-N-acetyl-D-mannosaminuronic acid dehydrogenase
MFIAEHFDSITMIGVASIGLPTAAMFAARRAEVIGIDINASAVETINQSRIYVRRA